MRAQQRLAGLVLAIATTATLALVPLTGASAQVQPILHWGQSPYYPNCIEGPCRIVFIVDKTENAGVAAQAQRWVDWMNYVRVTYSLSFPGFVYVGAAHGVQPDPSCATAAGIISLCRNDSIVNADCGTDPSVIRCAVFNYNASNRHINWTRSSIRSSTALDAADTWTVVCGALGRAIGLQPTQDPSSCMSNSLTLGSGLEKYYVQNDWLSYINIYNHPAGS